MTKIHTHPSTRKKSQLQPRQSSRRRRIRLYRKRNGINGKVYCPFTRNYEND